LLFPSFKVRSSGGLFGSWLYGPVGGKYRGKDPVKEISGNVLWSGLTVARPLELLFGTYFGASDALVNSLRTSCRAERTRLDGADISLIAEVYLQETFRMQGATGAMLK
jgi:hypothetical protein